MIIRQLSGLIVLFALSCVAQSAVILQYHHVSDDTPASTSTSPALFKQHLQYLAENDFTVKSLTDVMAALEAGESLPDKTVVLTFDDSYRSIYDTAFPLLQEFKFPFTVFINTAPVGSSPQDFMRWEEIKTMSDAGVVIANHTHSHPHMVRLKNDETREQWRQRIGEEIAITEEAITKHTGQNHKLLAYPYGEYDSEVIKLLRALGFKGIGQHSGAVGAGSNLYAVPRFPMGGDFGNMADFPSKVFSMPLPHAAVAWQDALGESLSDATVTADDRPILVLTLEDDSLAEGLTCYFRGGLMTKEIMGKEVRVQTETGLSAGRSRYNCTAQDAVSGRFYWFSQPWLVKGRDGRWQHQN
ncbi:MAG TPA: polysaccharide deacetylase family protein [Cellvibrionaceae bacterium]